VYFLSLNAIAHKPKDEVDQRGRHDILNPVLVPRSFWDARQHRKLTHAVGAGWAYSAPPGRLKAIAVQQSPNIRRSAFTADGELGRAATSAHNEEGPRTVSTAPRASCSCVRHGKYAVASCRARPYTGCFSTFLTTRLILCARVPARFIAS
jgi:hypothetical protein